MLDEPHEDFHIGDQFTLPAGAVRLGSRAPVTVGADVVVLKFLPENAHIDACVEARKAFLLDDCRVLPTTPDGLTFPEATGKMDQVDPSLARLPPTNLRGPAVAGKWLVEVLRVGRGSLVTRHERWSAESGVSRNSALCFEHEVLSRALQAAAVLDGINLKNMVFAEILLRRKQLLEEAVSEDPSNPSYEGAAHFMGTGSRRGGFVHPDLKKFVAEEIGNEAAILKEKRNAREACAKRRGRAKGHDAEA